MNSVAWKAAVLPLLLHAALVFGAPDEAANNGAANNAANDDAATVNGYGSGSSDGTEESVKQMTVPSGTLLRVEVSRRGRLCQGNEIEGRLLEPIYAENRLLIPSGARLHGTIAEVRPSPRGKRLNAKLHGDFTPLREPVIEWKMLTRADGSEYPLLGTSTTGPRGTLYFRTETPPRVSFVRRTWNSVTGRKDPPVQTAEIPSKSERLKRYFWSQMPIHPQYLEGGTQYEMVLTEDLQIAARALPEQPELSRPRALQGVVWVYSRLRSDLDSATAKAGDPVEAVVVQPVVDEQNRLILPQDSVLHGRVLSAEPSRRWGRNGNLRFVFHQVSWPTGYTQTVEAMPAAVESSPAARMAIDKEGGVARENEHSFTAPLLRGLLSGATFGDETAGRGKIAVTSDGFAIVGHVVGFASGSSYVGGSIGAVATGRSIYTHWLAHGKETHFEPATEIVLEMSPGHAYPVSADPMSAEK